MTDVTIRPAEESDAATILELIRELADFENLLHEVRASEADIRRDGFGDQRRFECLLAEVATADNGCDAVGFALFFHNYSTFEGRAGIYLEDLYVAERARGLGVGRRIMARLASIVIERNCARFDLAVLDWNPARDFYRRLGFESLQNWLPQRVDGERLRELAAEDSA